MLKIERNFDFKTVTFDDLKIGDYFLAGPSYSTPYRKVTSPNKDTHYNIVAVDTGELGIFTSNFKVLKIPSVTLTLSMKPVSDEEAVECDDDDDYYDFNSQR